ncbi:maltose ABC transporter substrate-binding protein [Paenibacillus sp. MER TA 81-3]|uniref:sugar ABC transporter substrate-binding protein n=1 Tax=Paenibacillus sp. MER TA 81-3 TaxID=2939573 RepID=UPI00203C739F|nr:maltose ABC transporter substrate-binding protein [Paenibacillus sp. MER TA 81-3]MCM3338842.1 maltose ABC transporter substrate-binding protein [Paenibacillus sp. MER TA 81-3]
MKKWVVTLLSVMMVFTITACSSGGGNNSTNGAGATTDAAESTDTATDSGAAESDQLVPEEGASLIVWESKESRPFIEAIAKEFTEKYKVPVKFEEVAAPDQVNKLVNDGPAGIAADIVVFPHDNLGKAVTAGLVFPNDFHEAQTREANSELAVNAASFDGVLYGYPRSVETLIMFYNKDLLPEAPKTMEEVVELSKKMNDIPNKKYTYMWEIGNFYYDYMYLATTGGYVFGNNGSDKADIGLNNEGAVKGAAFLQQFAKQVLPLTTSDVTGDVKKGLFSSGQLAMNIDGPWAIPDLKKAGINLGAAVIPSIDGQPSKTFSGVKAWYVNSYTKYPNAAKLFAEYASTKDAQLKAFELNGVVPSNKEAAADPTVANDPFTVAVLEQFKNSYPMPAIPEMGSVWSPMAAGLADVLNKGKDPKAALDNAVQQIKDANK